MFTGEIKTYLDVRTFVEATFGPLTDDSEVQFLTFLGNALDQMWTDLRRDPWYFNVWEIEPTEGTFILPADLAQPCEITGTRTILDEDEDPEDENTDDTVEEYTYSLHYGGCAASRSSSSDSCLPSGTVRGELSATTFIPTDTEPDSITVSGYRMPSKEFFTVVPGEGDEDDCLEWADIDLPRPYRNPYAKGVLGFMFFGAGDAPRCADWINLANGEFLGLQKANRRTANGSTAAELGIYQIGSKSILTPQSCGCDVALNWRLGL